MLKQNYMLKLQKCVPRATFVPGS